MYRFAGGRQPKRPIPPGDSAFFYHGQCVATSASGAPPSTTSPDVGINILFDAETVSSHSCKLNICLGGGGFNCIAFYAGTSFVFDIGQQISLSVIGPFRIIGEPSLPPPFPATIIGGTGRYVQFIV